MDDLWRALSSAVIGRHVCSGCGNESRSEAEMSQDFPGLFVNAEKSSEPEVKDAKSKENNRQIKEERHAGESLSSTTAELNPSTDTCDGN